MTPMDVLRGLNDVEGVVGSFLGAGDGQVLASSLPPFIGQADLGSAVARVSRLFQCSSECNLDANAGLLRFDDYKLFTNRYEWGVLCVLAENKTNARILRMATRIAAKHLLHVIKAEQASQDPAPEPARATPAPPEPVPADNQDSARYTQAGGFTAVTPASSVSGQHTISRALPEALTAKRTRAELSRTILYRGKRYDLP